MKNPDDIKESSWLCFLYAVSKTWCTVRLFQMVKLVRNCALGNCNWDIQKWTTAKSNTNTTSLGLLLSNRKNKN